MVKTFKAQCNFLPSNGNQEVKHHSMNSVLSSIDMWQSHVHPDPSSPWSLYSSHLYKKQQATYNNPSVSVKNELQCLMSDCKLHAHVIRNTYKGKWFWQACTQGGGGGGGTPGNSWWGYATQLSKSWPYFRPKIVIFHTCFQTSPLKSIPIFRPGL